MTTNLNPALAKGLFRSERKSETEQSLERASTGSDEQVPAGEAESGDTKLKRAAESNDGKGRG